MKVIINEGGENWKKGDLLKYEEDGSAVVIIFEKFGKFESGGTFYGYCLEHMVEEHKFSSSGGWCVNKFIRFEGELILKN